MSVFDPLGFLTPFTIQSGILMQEIWSTVIEWDEELPDSEFDFWTRWLTDFEKLRNFSMNRLYESIDYQCEEGELHIFCDTSVKASTAVAYWRFSSRQLISYFFDYVEKSSSTSESDDRSET